jgi:hypothetical protein
MDFKVIPGGDMLYISPGPSGDEETQSAFNDDWATDPIGLTIRQHSFSYTYPNDDFIIIRFVLENYSGGSIDGLYFGVLFDWDIVSYPYNSGGYDNPNGILWMAYNNASSLSNFRGVEALQGNLSGAFIDTSGTIAARINGGNGYTDVERWSHLTRGIDMTDLFTDNRNDLYQMLNFGPYNLAHGDVDSVTIAIVAGNSLADLQAAATAAAMVPTDVYEDAPTDILPSTFALRQNYPNPFNPVTSIEFDLPEPAEYELTIFNVLGQTVYSKTATGRAGTVKLNWEAGENPSGVYFYRIKTDSFTASKKMILLK